MKLSVCFSRKLLISLNTRQLPHQATLRQFASLVSGKIESELVGTFEEALPLDTTTLQVLDKCLAGNGSEQRKGKGDAIALFVYSFSSTPYFSFMSTIPYRLGSIRENLYRFYPAHFPMEIKTQQYPQRSLPLLAAL